MYLVVLKKVILVIANDLKNVFFNSYHLTKVSISQKFNYYEDSQNISNIWLTKIHLWSRRVTFKVAFLNGKQKTKKKNKKNWTFHPTKGKNNQISENVVPSHPWNTSIAWFINNKCYQHIGAFHACTSHMHKSALSVPHPDVFWESHFLEVKDWTV